MLHFAPERDLADLERRSGLAPVPSIAETSGGRSRTAILDPRATIAARSIACSSSRTFPGQPYFMSADIASGEIASTSFFVRAAARRTKSCAKAGMS
jgi:hypothetical protein